MTEELSLSPDDPNLIPGFVWPTTASTEEQDTSIDANDAMMFPEMDPQSGRSMREWQTYVNHEPHVDVGDDDENNYDVYAMGGQEAVLMGPRRYPGMAEVEYIPNALDEVQRANERRSRKEKNEVSQEEADKWMASMRGPQNHQSMAELQTQYPKERATRAEENLNFDAMSTLSLSSSDDERKAKVPFVPSVLFARKEKRGRKKGDDDGHGSNESAAIRDFIWGNEDLRDEHFNEDFNGMNWSDDDDSDADNLIRRSLDNSNDGDDEDNADENTPLAAASNRVSFKGKERAGTQQGPSSQSEEAANGVPAHNTPSKKRPREVQAGLSSKSDIVPAGDVAKPKRKYVKRALPKPKDEKPRKKQVSSSNGATASSGSVEIGSDGEVKKRGRGRPKGSKNRNTREREAAKEEAARAKGSGGNGTVVAGPSGTNSPTSPSSSSSGTVPMATPSSMNSSPQKDEALESLLINYKTEFVKFKGNLADQPAGSPAPAPVPAPAPAPALQRPALQGMSDSQRPNNPQQPQVRIPRPPMKLARLDRPPQHVDTNQSMGGSSRAAQVNPQYYYAEGRESQTGMSSHQTYGPKGNRSMLGNGPLPNGSFSPSNPRFAPLSNSSANNPAYFPPSSDMNLSRPQANETHYVQNPVQPVATGQAGSRDHGLQQRGFQYANEQTGGMQWRPVQSPTPRNGFLGVGVLGYNGAGQQYTSNPRPENISGGMFGMLQPGSNAPYYPGQQNVNPRFSQPSALQRSPKFSEPPRNHSTGNNAGFGYTPSGNMPNGAHGAMNVSAPQAQSANGYSPPRSMTASMQQPANVAQQQEQFNGGIVPGYTQPVNSTAPRSSQALGSPQQFAIDPQLYHPSSTEPGTRK